MKKLLERREVIKELSAERKQEIDEGVKLAKKVDSLRQTFGKEEAALKKFRAESLGVLNAEVLQLTLERDVLKKELESLSAERKKLVEPLEEREEQVRLRSLWNRDENERLAIKEHELAIAEKNLAEKERALALENARIEEMLSSAAARAQESQDMFFEASVALSDVESKAEELQATVEAHEKAMDDRETHIKDLESGLKIRREHQDKRELELNRRETLISDRYQALLRTEKRIQCQ